MQQITDKTRVFVTSDINRDLQTIISEYSNDKIFVLLDEGSFRNCSKYISDIKDIVKERTIVIRSGDEYKNLDTANQIWQFLSNNGATRHSLLINIGGGMPCDLGGFCASTFKRGIDFVNVPTTVLAQVDASLGGKTGMNLGCLKNEIGVFASARYVLISNKFLTTLDRDNLLSGFAEMIKHAIIADAKYLIELQKFNIDKPNFELLQDLICTSIQIKDKVVESDPTENNLRKSLNFGHTFGHAFETYMMRIGHPILHGIAVAYGMVCELLLSQKILNLDGSVIDVCQYITALYGMPNITTDHLDALIELMHHDKKNDQKGINFSLIPRIGSVEVNHVVSEIEIKDVLNQYFKLYSR